MALRLIKWWLARRGLRLADAAHLDAIERELHRLRKRLGIAPMGTERVATDGR